MFFLATILPPSFGEENGVIENLQLVVLALGLYLSFRLRLQKLPAWGGKQNALCYAGMLFFFLLFMREISWGRTIFLAPDGDVSQYEDLPYGFLVHPLVGFLLVLTLYQLYRAKTWLYLKFVKIPVSSFLLLLCFIILTSICEKHGLFFFRGSLAEELSEFGAYMMMLYLLQESVQTLKKISGRNNGFGGTKEKQLQLTPELLLGKGTQKECYLHPHDPSLCVKICYRLPNTDLARELHYRQICKKRHLRSTLLTKYFGSLKTNLGMGFVFEHVNNYDGSTAVSLKEIFNAPQSYPEYLNVIEDLLSAFKNAFLKESIVVANMESNNFLVQKLGAPPSQQFKVRIIDNIGSPVLIPLAYYSNYLARLRARRYWQLYIDDLRRCYPEIITAALYAKLK